MTEILDPSGQIDTRFSGLGRMNEAIDDITTSFARPNPDLLINARDPYSYSPAEISELPPALRIRTAYNLFKDVPLNVLEQGRKEDQPKSTAQERLESYGFEYELDYPLSQQERNFFMQMSGYLKEGMKAFDETEGDDGLESRFIEDLVPERLDMYKSWIETGKGNRPPKHIFQGFKTSRLERYLLEEQIKAEKPTVGSQNTDQLPKAA